LRGKKNQENKCYFSVFKRKNKEEGEGLGTLCPQMLPGPKGQS
jgi:hypothetical protein